MTRRDFLRCVGYAIAAIAAGKPIASAWLAALERQRRREMIIAQLQYQAAQSGQEPQQIAWNGDVDPIEWEELDDVGPSAYRASYNFAYRAETMSWEKFMLQDLA